MPQLIHNYNLFVASSNELMAQREDVEKIVAEINSIYGEFRGIKLSTLRWERDTYSQLGRPQQVVNDQIGRYDILVGMMWKRYGMDARHPEHPGESGTAEEFRLAREAYEKGLLRGLLFYFFEEAFWPTSIKEIEQLKRVLKFRKSIETRGFLNAPVKKLSEFRDKFRIDLMRLVENELLRLQKTEKITAAKKPTHNSNIRQNVKLRSYEMLVDLTKRKRLKTTDGFDMSTTYKLVKTVVASAAPEVKTLIFRHATEGSHIRLIAEHSNIAAEALLRAGEDRLYLPIRERNLNKTKIKGRASLGSSSEINFPAYSDSNLKRSSLPLEKTYFISVPYREPGQEIIYALEYANGYQVEKGGWAGAVAPGNVDELILKVRFPRNKRPNESTFIFRRGNPYTKYGLMDQQAAIVYDRKNLVVRVTVPEVKSGEGCALLWDW